VNILFLNYVDPVRYISLLLLIRVLPAIALGVAAMKD
jgi:NADH:ubiquinone oxidoreductase subunit 6 (subunit J)